DLDARIRPSKSPATIRWKACTSSGSRPRRRWAKRWFWMSSGVRRTGSLRSVLTQPIGATPRRLNAALRPELARAARGRLDGVEHGRAQTAGLEPGQARDRGAAGRGHAVLELPGMEPGLEREPRRAEHRLAGEPVG